MMPAESIRVSADRTCRFRQITGDGFRLAVELTTRCNLACAHCFVPRTALTIPYPTLDSILKQAWQAGCRKVILTGGEPLLHPELRRIVARCVELGMLADLNSNLLLLNERNAAELAEAGLREVSVSLYGRPETHAALTKNPQAYANTVSSIRLMRKHNVTVDIHSALWQGNLQDAGHLLALCEELGCASLTFFSIIAMNGDATFRIARSEALSAIDRLRGPASIPVRSVGFEACRLEECTMGAAVIGITADLHMKPCLLARPLPEHAVSLHEHDFPTALAIVRREASSGRWQPACAGEP